MVRGEGVGEERSYTRERELDREKCARERELEREKTKDKESKR